MKSRHPKSEPVDPASLMMRGETEFEEKRIKADFVLVFGKASQLHFTSLIDSYEWVYRAGRAAGRADDQNRVEQLCNEIEDIVRGKRESLGSPLTETLNTSPLDASVRETAGAIKEQANGTTKSD